MREKGPDHCGHSPLTHSLSGAVITDTHSPQLLVPVGLHCNNARGMKRKCQIGDALTTLLLTQKRSYGDSLSGSLAAETKFD
jgi:hypothetical protein